MKQNNTSFKLLSTVLLASLVLSGCSSTKSFFGKRDNGTLAYQDSKLLKPIQIPASKQPKAFVQLYPTVNLGASTINTKNASGKQYQLPAPKRAVQ